MLQLQPYLYLLINPILYAYFCYILGVKTPHSRDYEIQGSSISKLFTITAAAANLFFVFNTGMLPEIQVETVFLLYFNKM